VSAAQSGGALVLINASETVSLSLSPASTTAGILEESIPRFTSSRTAVTESGSRVTESLGGTAADGSGGGSASSATTAEVENVSGGDRRMCAGSLSGLSLYVFVVACAILL
jgi:hypothetical protein